MPGIVATFEKYVLAFKKPAVTSRHTLQQHVVYLLKLTCEKKTSFGEASPLPGLSPDFGPAFEPKLTEAVALLTEGVSQEELQLDNFPAIRFAVETARLHLAGEPLFHSSFTSGQAGLPINGLVWMDTAEAMLAEALQKVTDGFRTIKFKVGSLDFDAECRMLESFRKRHNAWQVDIRLDANGAFAPDDAASMLKELARFEVHSIEQPIKPGHEDLLAQLCHTAPLAIALDEELINRKADRAWLTSINPAYLVLKPTLLGGLSEADNWVKLCRKMSIGWWATSALESNVGLNAIAQWAASHANRLPHGLGTGSLYQTNFQSRMIVKNGHLHYQPQQ